jgi:hypothetical protein
MPEETLDRTPIPPTTGVVSFARTHERHPCDLPSFCRPASGWGDGERSWAVTIRDVSLGGMLLVLRRRFERGTCLEVELPGGDGQEPYTVVARVVNLRAEGGGWWALGCRFLGELAEDELRRVLARPGAASPAAAAASPELPAPVARSLPPRVLERVREQRTIDSVRFQLWTPQGIIMDCPIQRLNVPEGWPVPAGKRLAMYVSPPGTPLVKIRVNVLECVRESEQWVLRCQLVSPDASDLLRNLPPPAANGSGQHPAVTR